MTNPDCLIMDEPSEGLAPLIIQHLWANEDVKSRIRGSEPHHIIIRRAA
jgi:ABC-type branched-subunit amino acid transport system ATPase component